MQLFICFPSFLKENLRCQVCLSIGKITVVDHRWASFLGLHDFRDWRLECMSLSWDYQAQRRGLLTLTLCCLSGAIHSLLPGRLDAQIHNGTTLLCIQLRWITGSDNLPWQCDCSWLLLINPDEKDAGMGIAAFYLISFLQEISKINSISLWQEETVHGLRDSLWRKGLLWDTLSSGHIPWVFDHFSTIVFSSDVKPTFTSPTICYTNDPTGTLSKATANWGRCR